MHEMGVNRICRRLAATTGLLLFLAANAAGADSLVADTDAATAAASRTLPSDVAAIEVDVSVSSSSVSSSSVSAAQNLETTSDQPVAQADDTGAFLGQLVARYFESYN